MAKGERKTVKKYEFIFDTDKTTVVDKLLDGVIKSDFSENVKLFEKDAIYGRLSKNTNKIFLYHGTPLRTSCRPIFSAKILEGKETAISGIWRLPIHINIFFIMWYLFLIWVSVIPLIFDGNGNLPLLYLMVILFAVVGLLFIISGYLIERKRMKKVIEYIENVQKVLLKNEI